MKLIYHCYGSAHSSIVAAAIHLKKLPTERTPTYEEIIALEDFDQSRNDSLGHIFYKGTDEEGIEIYTMGMGPESELVKRTMQSMIKHHNASQQESERIFFAQALPHINRIAKVGGALSRRYGIVGMGRYLAARGICQSYQQLVSFVGQTKNKIKKLTKS